MTSPLYHHLSSLLDRKMVIDAYDHLERGTHLRILIWFMDLGNDGGPVLALTELEGGQIALESDNPTRPSYHDLTDITVGMLRERFQDMLS